MGRYDDDWGTRRPNTRGRRRKPYNDDYREDDRRRGSSRGGYGYADEDDDVRIYRRDGGSDSGSGRDDRTADGRDGGAGADRDSASRRERRNRDSSGRRRKGPEEQRKGGIGCLIPLAVIVLILFAAAVAGVFLFSRLWSLVDGANFRSAEIAVNSDLPSSVKKYTGDYRTIMFFGVDSRDNTTLQSGALSDSNIIAAINKKTGEVKLLSIYRDTYVETTAGDHMKLTEVYNKYGAKEQLQTINRNFDMNVSEYITVNWKTVADTINALGGIDLDLSEDECRAVNKYIDEVIESTGVESSHISVDDGIQHVDGIQAVTYCRLRKGLGDDYKRTERQRTVISKTLAKAKSIGFREVLAVCEKVFPGLSSSLSLMDIVTLATGMGNYEVKESAGFPFDLQSEDGGRYFIFPVTLASNAAKLHEYLYDNTEYTPSATVQEISDMIADYSGFTG